MSADTATLPAVSTPQTSEAPKKKRVNWEGVDVNRPVKELTAELGCSEDAVHQRRSKIRRDNGESAPSKSRYDWKNVDLTRPPAEVAAELGCHIQAVYYHRYKAGIKGDKVKSPTATSTAPVAAPVVAAAPAVQTVAPAMPPAPPAPPVAAPAPPAPPADVQL